MMELTFLGTSGSTPTKDRNMPSVALVRDGDIYLFDCGEGTQMQIFRNSLNISRVKAIFITHTHGDHIIGIAGLIRTLALNRRQTPLEIFVPAGEENKIKILLTFDKALIEYPVLIKGVKPGVVFKGKDFEVSAFRLNHTITTLGYTFKENDKIRFMKKECAALGLKGTMFRELGSKGSLKVNGKLIKLKDVTTKTKGVKIVYAADSRPTQNTINSAKDADLLIHETSFGEEMKKLARERGHCTALEAAQMAKKAKCKRLVMFHFSARYNDSGVLQNEARKVFKNSDAAKDGMKILL